MRGAWNEVQVVTDGRPELQENVNSFLKSEVCMTRLTFAEAEYADEKCISPRKYAFGRIRALISGSWLKKQNDKRYQEALNGYQHFPLPVMFSMHCPQLLYRLLDEAFYCKGVYLLGNAKGGWKRSPATTPRNVATSADFSDEQRRFWRVVYGRAAARNKFKERNNFCIAPSIDYRCWVGQSDRHWLFSGRVANPKSSFRFARSMNYFIHCVFGGLVRNEKTALTQLCGHWISHVN